MILLLLMLLLPLRPDPTLTPGQTIRVLLSDLCRPGYSKTVRNVSATAKRDVFARYSIPPSGRFEVDHLISLELGGRIAAYDRYITHGPPKGSK